MWPGRVWVVAKVRTTHLPNFFCYKHVTIQYFGYDPSCNGSDAFMVTVNLTQYCYPGCRMQGNKYVITTCDTDVFLPWSILSRTIWLQWFILLLLVSTVNLNGLQRIHCTYTSFTFTQSSVCGLHPLTRALVPLTSRSKSVMPTLCTRTRAAVLIAINAISLAKLRPITAIMDPSTNALRTTKEKHIVIPWCNDFYCYDRELNCHLLMNVDFSEHKRRSRPNSSPFYYFYSKIHGKAQSWHDNSLAPNNG